MAITTGTAGIGDGHRKQREPVRFGALDRPLAKTQTAVPMATNAMAATGQRIQPLDGEGAPIAKREGDDTGDEMANIARVHERSGQD